MGRLTNSEVILREDDASKGNLECVEFRMGRI